MYQLCASGVPARSEPLGGVLLVVGDGEVFARRRRLRRLRCRGLAAVAVRFGCVRAGVERRFQLLGVGADALVLGGEVVLGPFVADVGERVGLAHEAGGAGAVGDPGGEAVVVGEVERLFGGDAQAGAGVGVVADHRRVDGHRDPGGLLGVLGVAHPEQEAGSAAG